MQDNILKAKWIAQGEARSSEELSPELLESEFGWKVGLQALKKAFKKAPSPAQSFQGVDQIVVISDIHGQFGLAERLLQQHGVMDANNNWIFGKGHLVVNGDIAGRGQEVTEVFWLVFKLEQQAEAAGGKVHYLVGNHEQMLLSDDLRYTHAKYTHAARTMGISVREMYGPESVLGAWLRKRPAIVTIGDYLFVHAGISPDFIVSELTAKKTNKVFYSYILGTKRPSRQLGRTIDFLNGESGPVWFRGYFVDGGITSTDLDNTLAYFHAQRIVVGHTSLRQVTAMHRGRVIAVDSNIKEGESGEILVIDRGQYFRGNLTGERIPL